MSECGCKTKIHEDHSNPSLEEYKLALKNLSLAIKSAHKTEEGKKLSTEYWTDLVKMLKKAKLGVSMMELGIDDEEEIKISHDATIDKVQPKPEEETEEQPPEQDKKKKAPTTELYDILNHFSILLNEEFEKVESDGVEFSVENNNRGFKISHSDKFYLVSDDYNYELGSCDDLNEVVETLVKLTMNSDQKLKSEYEKLAK